MVLHPNSCWLLLEKDMIDRDLNKGLGKTLFEPGKLIGR